MLGLATYYLLAYITYFIVTVIIGFCRACGKLGGCRHTSCGDRMPAAGTLYKTKNFLPIYGTQ